MPHVYFNTRYIGGVDATIKELKRWDSSTRYDSPMERYEAEIEPGFDPSSPHLVMPEPSDRVRSPPAKSRKANLFLEAPNGEVLSGREMTELLKELVPADSNKYNGSEFKRSFKGKELVNAVAKRYGISGEDAMQFAAGVLCKEGLVRHVDSVNFPPRSKSSFRNSSSEIYRLQCYAKATVVNSYLTWPVGEEPVDDVMFVVDNLSRLLSVMEMSSLDPVDGKLNMSHAVNLSKFSKFEEAACELQNISKETLTLLTEDEMTAFALNLYHVMIRYAYLKYGIPSTEKDRIHFMKSVMFDMAGEYYTLQEWVDILTSRSSFVVGGGNGHSGDESFNGSGFDTSQTNDSSFKDDLSQSHEESTSAGSETVSVKHDKRIFFALFIGAFGGSRWSLPFSQFSAENLDQELDIAARVFCQEDRNVLVNRQEHRVELLSSVFKTYFRHYVSRQRQMLKLLTAYLGGKKLSDLAGMMNSGDKIKVSYKEPELGLHTVSGPWYQHRESHKLGRGSLLKGLKVVKATS